MKNEQTDTTQKGKAGRNDLFIYTFTRRINRSKKNLKSHQNFHLQTCRNVSS